MGKNSSSCGWSEDILFMYKDGLHPTTVTLGGPNAYAAAQRQHRYEYDQSFFQLH